MYPIQSLARSGCALIAFLAGTLVGADNISDPLTKVTFPNNEHIDEHNAAYDLQLTGEDTRAKISVKIFTVAHYLQDPKQGSFDAVLEQVFDDNKAKQLTLIWVKDVELHKIKEDFYQTFQNVLSEDEKESLDSYIDAFTRLFDRDARKTEHYSLNWLPGGRIQLFINGKLMGELKNVEFAKALWSIWLGPKSIVDRNKMLTLITNNFSL